MTELEEGRIIGSYRVVKCIGQGGMGTVYEVEHIELGVHYALKTFTFDPENKASYALKVKFLEEGKVLARLKHPNIAHVFDLAFDEESQMPYFVMDLVTYEDGESYTAEDVELSAIDEETVYGWFKELASALDYIHEQGIVHRDIKPGNLLLDKDAHVVLTDFGISRIFGAKIKTDVEATKTMATKTGRGKLVLGTEKYMAPEVADGEEATPEADAYSLGVMLLRWLTGFYYSDNPGCIALLSGKKYLWLPVIARLIAPASRRPQTYSDLVKQLKPLAGAQAKVDDQSQAKKPKKTHRKLKENILAAVCSLFIIGVVAMGGYFGWQYVERQNAVRDRQVAELKARMEADKAEAAKKELEEKAEAERKAAEEKRIAEEKEKEAAEAKAAEEKRRQDEENARTRIAKNANATVRETPVAKPVVPPPEKKREFIQESVVTVAKDYGPIPDKNYAWLMNGNTDAPQKQSFLLANGAQLDLIPQKAATFYMTNERNNPKGWHKVTLTRPFWMTRTCVTVNQWREFAPNDCEDCREVEKAIDGKALLYMLLKRQAVDEFCAYLTAKYAKQLPKGYVFRLPSEAEWEYVMNHEAVVAKHDQPGVRWWSDNVCVCGRTFRERFASIRTGKSALQQIRDEGCWNRYHVGGLSLPLPTDVLDMYGHERWMLDHWPRDTNSQYADSEEDPLRWKDGWDCYRWRDMDQDRNGHGANAAHLCHLVLGPDLIGEKAWQNKREKVDYSKAPVPKQNKKFDPTKIPNKISRPREIALKRVGGKEMIFCEISKGKFSMSNVDGQAKAYHRVELTKPFWMSKFLVTVDEWREFAPNDFHSRAVRMAEKLFPKNPVSVNNSYNRWTAYCDFLNQRYGHLLPQGYVFRLPTEAEWEWAFIADEKGDIRKMSWECCNDSGHLKEGFKAMIEKARAPKWVRYDALGFIGAAFIGGRTQQTGFGVFDFVVHGGRDVYTIDTFDTQGWTHDDGGIDHWVADATSNIRYDEKEIDPVRYGGRLARFALKRSMGAGRQLPHKGHCAHAHVVIAPDILNPLKEREVATFPQEDFGGVFLGDLAKREAQSSKHDEWRNDETRFKRMMSRENVITDHFDRGRDMRGFHTSHEEEPWIMIDLGKRCEITGLAIDGFWDATRHLCIWVSDDGKHEKLVDKEELMRKRYRIDLQKKNVKGRYIRIGREPKIEKNWFFLDKVVIYGKEK